MSTNRCYTSFAVTNGVDCAFNRLLLVVCAEDERVLLLSLLLLLLELQHLWG